jgi:predicted membrane protein
MKTPWHLWVVGVLALVWNAGGAYDYLMMKLENEAYLAQIPPEHLAYYLSYPLWVNIAWALGVWMAVLGAVLLLLRSRHAVAAFVLSFVGLVVNTIWGQFLSETPMSALMGDMGAAMLGFMVAIYLVAVLLWAYARAQARVGVLR